MDMDDTLVVTRGEGDEGEQNGVKCMVTNKN